MLRFLWIFLFIFLFDLIGAHASPQDLCAPDPSQQEEVFANALGFGGLLQSWNELADFFANHPMKNKEKVLSTIASELRDFEGKQRLRLEIAQIIQMATQQSPELRFFLNAYHQELQQKLTILNSQIIPEDHETWAQERAEIKQLLLEELERKYGSTLMRVLSNIDGFSNDQRLLLENHFFDFYGLDLSPPWVDSFDVVHRYLYDTFYSADLLDKYGKVGRHSFQLQAVPATPSPYLEMIVVIDQPDAERPLRINVSMILAPFSDQVVSINLCDFRQSQPYHTCTPQRLEQWCAQK